MTWSSDLLRIAQIKTLLKDAINRLNPGSITNDTPFREYVDALEEAKVPRYVINGTLTNNNNILSGFSTSNFAIVPFGGKGNLYYLKNYLRYNPTDSFTEEIMYIGFTAPSTFSGDQPIVCGSNLSGGDARFADIFINNSGKLCFWQGSTATESSLTCNVDTDYLLKIVDDGSYLTFYYSTDYNKNPLDVTDWTSIMQITVYGNWQNVQALSIGRGYEQYFNGKIDMNKFIITFDDNIIYQAVELGVTTPAPTPTVTQEEEENNGTAGEGQDIGGPFS